jgi:hypothetical protein
VPQPQYSRTNPSARYARLLAQYRQMHRDGEVQRGVPPDQTFPGKSLPPQAGHIKRLIDLTGAKTLLDYGSGKGQQYQPLPFTDPGGTVHLGIRAWWGVELRCYDPGYEAYAVLPSGKFDGVISTDVLEHCPEEDMPWIVAELFGFAHRFVFANVACFPAAKRLPNGQNAHCTVRPLKWWRELVDRIAPRHAAILYELRFQVFERKAGGEDALVEKVLTNLERWEAGRAQASA